MTKSIRMDPKKIEAIKNWTEPKEVKVIRVLLGFAKLYRRFIPGFSHLSAPLIRLTKKDVTFLFDEVQD